MYIYENLVFVLSRNLSLFAAAPLLAIIDFNSTHSAKNKNNSAVGSFLRGKTNFFKRTKMLKNIAELCVLFENETAICKTEIQEVNEISKIC